MGLRFSIRQRKKRGSRNCPPKASSAGDQEPPGCSGLQWSEDTWTKREINLEEGLERKIPQALQSKKENQLTGLQATY